MRIIISPAKKMNVDTGSFACEALPQFLPKTEQLYERLRSMSYGELKALWKCNDQIAALNFERLKTMDLRRGLTPAILAYEGIQYQYMSPGVFTYGELDYMREHLRILSGFYGILRPFDGVTPYRLEMQAKLRMGQAKDLYAFWGGSIAGSLFQETDCIINLASAEYSRCVSAYLTDGVQFITCIFGELSDGKVIQKGVHVKMARGEMVRFMAEKNITEPEELQSFCALGYCFDGKLSTDTTYVFLK